MSDTPRTDRTDLYDYQTAIDFARELERENNTLRTALTNLRTAFDNAADSEHLMDLCKNIFDTTEILNTQP